MTRVAAGLAGGDASRPERRSAGHQRIAGVAAYTLRHRDPASADGELQLTVWEMSVLRDEMLSSGAAHASFPPAQLLSLTARCPSGLKGIPAYKLAGPDGWLVRPDEIAEALRVLRTGAQPQNSLWHRWVDFLKAARRRGGFTVG